MPRKPTKPQPRQRGTISPEGDGKFRVRVYVGKDENGKREYASKLVVGTISQAKKVLAALVSEIDTNTLARPTGETTHDFIKRYLADVKENAVEAATMRGYRIQFKNHISPALGKIKLEELTAFRIQQWIGSLVEKGLSYASIRHAYVVLDMALSQAVAWNMLQKNPATGVSLPVKLKYDKKEMQTFDAAQMHRFLVGIDTARPQLRRNYKLLFHLLLTCGLRPSEACALRWSDINIDASTLTVRRALTQVTSGHWEVRNRAKTSSGIRTMVVPRSVLALIPAHRAEQARAKLAAGPEWHDGDFVFTARTGHHMMLNNVSRAWKRLCQHAGVPMIRLYDARHTATTLELEAGVDPKTVSQRRGHANVGFTLHTYAHVLKSMDEAAASAMDGVLEKARLAAEPQPLVSNG